MTDLFNTIENTPTKVQQAVNRFEQRYEASDMSNYDSCKLLVKDLEAVGYSCEYGLDGQPFELVMLESDTERLLLSTSAKVHPFTGHKTNNQYGQCIDAKSIGRSLLERVIPTIGGKEVYLLKVI